MKSNCFLCGRRVGNQHVCPLAEALESWAPEDDVFAERQVRLPRGLQASWGLADLETEGGDVD